MPYHDEEYPDQPLWQSVLLFCCKGMIEGIMVILFFWLLVQVLFTKHLEVHLQILLLVGLIIFCLSLILGCILCWRKTLICSVKDKDPEMSAAAPPEPVTFTRSSPSSAATTAARQPCEDTDGDLLEYPSTFTSPGPSVVEFTSRPISNQAPAASNEKEQPVLNFSLRRLSTPPLTSPLYKPIDASRASLFTFPKLELLSKTCKALQRRCTITGDRPSYNEHSRLKNLNAVSSSTPEEQFPLTRLSYGSSASCKTAMSPKPCLHFTMAFSPEQKILTVTVLNISETPYALEDVFVLGSLPPLYTCPIKACVQSSLSHEPLSKVLLLKVSSVSDLQMCTLKIAVHTQEPHDWSATALGELEAKCGERDWTAECLFHMSQELDPPKKIFISLQYQTLAHRVKATILRVDNVDSIVHTPAATDYQVVINLSSRESKGGSCTVWDTSFLFDLPPGNISQLLLMLEFITMQSISECYVLLQSSLELKLQKLPHWRDICNMQMEQVRRHIVQPGLLQSAHTGKAA